MKWVTTANVHFDRVASPWLIKRFIDPAAEFLFVARACFSEPVYGRFGSRVFYKLFA